MFAAHGVDWLQRAKWVVAATRLANIENRKAGATDYLAVNTAFATPSSQLSSFSTTATMADSEYVSNDCSDKYCMRLLTET